MLADSVASECSPSCQRFQAVAPSARPIAAVARDPGSGTKGSPPTETLRASVPPLALLDGTIAKRVVMPRARPASCAAMKPCNSARRRASWVVAIRVRAW